jgi:elongation factor P hydroxylase
VDNFSDWWHLWVVFHWKEAEVVEMVEIIPKALVWILLVVAGILLIKYVSLTTALFICGGFATGFYVGTQM